MRKVAGIGLLTLLISVVFFVIYGIPWGMIQAQKESKHYVEDKYGEVFQVKMPRFWVMDGTFHAEAAPIARPDVTFSVGTSQGEKGLSDSYILECWRDVATLETEGIIHTYYNEATIYTDFDSPMIPEGKTDLFSYKSNAVTIQVVLKETSLSSRAQEGKKLYALLTQFANKGTAVNSFSTLYQNGLFKLTQDELRQVQNEHDLIDYWANT